ncbi:hypothetical protein NYE67_10910 [Solibacillus sp. FSL W8-0474]|uniref:hypothetical protein n=1 Tax=Solibacillus sp. FSL W8-0474 TaxID=2975336 RepID=UPI0030FBC4A2
MKIIEQTPFTLSPLEERILNNPIITSKANRKTYIILKHMYEENIHCALIGKELNVEEFIISINKILNTFDLELINSVQTFYNYKKKLVEFILI